MTLPSTGGCQLGAELSPGYPAATLHGVLMWFTWSVLSLVQLYTNRYAKHWWRYRHTVHNVVGVISLLLTIISLFVVLNWLGFAFYFDHWHNVSGTIFMILTILLMLGGIAN